MNELAPFRVASVLREAGGAVVAYADLKARARVLSRRALHVHVCKLRALGFVVATERGRGMRLVSEPARA